MCLAAAWDVASRRPSVMPIYNCTSGTINALSVKEFFADFCVKYTNKHPMSKLLHNLKNAMIILMISQVERFHIRLLLYTKANECMIFIRFLLTQSAHI